MIKAIMGEIDYEGSLKIGHNAKIGYFAQNQAALLDGELTVFDTIDQIAVGDVRVKIKDLLGAFMFSGDDTTKKVKVLSGGEKTRLAMIKLLLEPVNVLILDEHVLASFGFGPKIFLLQSKIGIWMGSFLARKDSILSLLQQLMEAGNVACQTGGQNDRIITSTH